MIDMIGMIDTVDSVRESLYISGGAEQLVRYVCVQYCAIIAIIVVMRKSNMNVYLCGRDTILDSYQFVH